MEGNGGEGAAAEGPRRSPRGGGAIVSYVTPKYSPGDAANGRACLQGSRGPKGLQGSRLAEACKDALKLPMSKEPTPLLALPAPPT